MPSGPPVDASEPGRARTPTRSAGSPAAVEATATRSSSCRTGSTPTPRPAFEERQAAAWVAEVLRAARLRGRASGGLARDRDPGDAPRRSRRRRVRGSGSSPSTTRCPGSATAAATTRWPRRASAPRSPSPRSPTSWPARSCSSARPAEERGSGKATMIEDGLFDGHRRRAAVPPLRPEPRREPAARLRGRRGRLPRAPGARGVRPVGGPERARRDDPAVQLGRAVATAAPARRAGPRDHPGGRDGREHHPGPDPRLVHAPQRRPGVLRGDEGRASGRSSRPPRSRPGRRSRSRSPAAR